MAVWFIIRILNIKPEHSGLQYEHSNEQTNELSANMNDRLA